MIRTLSHSQGPFSHLLYRKSSDFIVKLNMIFSLFEIIRRSYVLAKPVGANSVKIDLVGFNIGTGYKLHTHFLCSGFREPQNGYFLPKIKIDVRPLIPRICKKI